MTARRLTSRRPAATDFRAEPLPAPRRQKHRRKGVARLVVLLALLMLGNAVVGERGVVASFRADRQALDLQLEIERLQRENESLRRQTDRLQDDPRAIEDIARRDLGLIRDGEILVVVR